jgi:hypothetical protein
MFVDLEAGATKEKGKDLSGSIFLQYKIIYLSFYLFFNLSSRLHNLRLLDIASTSCPSVLELLCSELSSECPALVA